MSMPLLGKKKSLHFERVYAAPVDAVWRAWTRPDDLRQWWGPEKTVVAECEVDLRVGGRLYIVTVASEAMGKYAGTRWPMEGTYTSIDERRQLTYDARQWTEGSAATETIQHSTEVTFIEQGPTTSLTLHIDVSSIGPGLKTKMAAFGMKWGYKSQLDSLERYLAG